mmetsp:Transcript_23683/g.66520  ORF Transcript_23683/g.66520 Transcript_23683/m.66520 type:complete len:221 (-) Transcript_23683:4762-5424(-)
MCYPSFALGRRRRGPHTSNLKDDGGSAYKPGRIPFDMGKRHAGKTGGGSFALGARARQPCVEARSFGAPLTLRFRRFFSTTTTSLCADWGTRLFQGGRSAGAEEGRFFTLVDVASGIHDVGGVFGGPSNFLCAFSWANFLESSRDLSSFFFRRLAFASAPKSLCKTSARSLRRKAAAKSRRRRRAPVSAVRGRATGDVFTAKDSLRFLSGLVSPAVDGRA